MITFETKVVDAVVVTSFYSSFRGNSVEWQNSYFELLSWHNTYYLDYGLSICGRGDNPCVRVIVPADGYTPDSLVSLLTDLHYGDIKTYSIKVCCVEPSLGIYDPDIDEWFFE